MRRTERDGNVMNYEIYLLFFAYDLENHDN